MSLPYRSLFIKYLLFIFNLIFFFSGIILLVVGLVIQASYKDYDPVLDESFFSVPVLLIVIGTIIFVVSFFGCCGAYTENYCLTMSFCVSLILIFILELSGGIAGYLLRDRVSDVLESQMKSSLAHYENSTQIQDMWNEIQTNLHCCGVNSSSDWINLYGKLPSSCCERKDQCFEADTYPDKCITRLGNLLQNYAGILGGVGVGIAIIQILGYLFSMIAKSIKLKIAQGRSTDYVYSTGFIAPFNGEALKTSYKLILGLFTFQLLGIIFACNLASSIKDYESV